MSNARQANSSLRSKIWIAIFAAFSILTIIVVQVDASNLTLIVVCSYCRKLGQPAWLQAAWGAVKLRTEFQSKFCIAIWRSSLSGYNWMYFKMVFAGFQSMIYSLWWCMFHHIFSFEQRNRENVSIKIFYQARDI